MKYLTLLAAFVALGFALSAPSALAQDTQGCSKTKCVWGWGPESIGELCNFGLVGPFDSTSKVKIMYGIRDCTTTTYDKVCCEVDDFVIVIKRS